MTTGEDSELGDMTESMAEVMSLDGDVERLAAFYAKWAEHYDDDVASHGYGLPAMMVETLLTAAPAIDRAAVEVLDAGCGTGLVGAVLAAAGFTTIDGVDLSPEMIEGARARGIYRHLEGGVDLTQPPPDRLAGRYDVVTVGGVFTVGHISPNALLIAAGFARPGGVLVVSTRRAYQEETGFDRFSAEVVARDELELLTHIADAPYTMDSTGDYWAYRTPG